MNLLFWLAIPLIATLLAWDWLVKRRRVAGRAEVSDCQFLRAYRGSQETAADDVILETRRRIARELGLPVSKIQPQDELTALRDRYCLVVSGHLALGDLFDDLRAAGRGGTKGRGLNPKTVHESIAAFIAVGEASDRPEP